MAGLTACAALVVKYCQVADELRGVQWHVRSGVDLVVERLAQGVLVECGHGGGRA
ncbi:hypothetical protein SDC9_204754 [bioreactor metagenome]|uniref:Uncharacterized protein n=1 Tax=bioreactor metagenome TaxID=1076179 RepID=A0A645J1L5_9ZZZZ